VGNYTPYDQWCDDMYATGQNIIAAWKEHYEWFAESYSDNITVPKDVEDLFERFRNIDPAAAEKCVEELTDAMMTVASHTSLLADAHQRVSDYWDGDAADGFMDYLNAMINALTNLQDRLNGFILVARAELQLAEDFQQDVLDLVQKTLQGIEDAEIHQKKMAFAIAGSIAAVVGSLAAGPFAVAAVSTALASGAASVASEELEGNSVMDVVDEFVTAGHSLTGGLGAQGSALVGGLYKLDEYLTEGHLPEVRPARPEIITAVKFDPGLFYPEGFPEELRASVPTGDLVEEPAQSGDQESDHVGGKADITVFGTKVGEVDNGPNRDVYPEEGPAA
jgi:hypothetical protein